MHKLYKLVLSISVAFILLSIFGTKVFAEDILPEIVITQVQAGALSSLGNVPATQEFISIYNNGETDVDISDWCLTNKATVIVCFDDRADNITYHVSSHNYVTISSDNFAVQNIFIPDFAYTPLNASSGSIVASNDIISLIDANGLAIDNVSWSVSLTGGTLLLRQPDLLIEGKFIDTNNSSTDFKKVSVLDIPTSGLVEIETPDICPNILGFQPIIPGEYSVDDLGNCIAPQIDVCENIDGIQPEIPSGFGYDESVGCVPDVCVNIPGLQIIVPFGKQLDNDGNCFDIDECSNLPENQSEIPDGFFRGDDNTCVLNILPIIITELLPNPLGTDDGNEYIEIYNPNDSAVDLIYYYLYIGSDDIHFLSFPVGAIIEAKQYLKFNDHEISFTLVNTTSSIRLRAIDNSFINYVPAYNNPDDGQAWALIDNIWQYTNRPTPGLLNLSSLIDNDIEDEVGNILVSCAANQYRNPLTNRCRLIATSDPTLVPCKDGQYRSEETNRCRSIISDIADLVPCAEGQERNPATNRCRSTVAVLGSSDLVACKEGQERNPETNRCRNIVSMPTANYAPEKTVSNSNNNTTWLILAGVATLAIGYAIWEWRLELAKIAKKLVSFFHIVK